MLKLLTVCRPTKLTSEIISKSLKNLYLNTKMSYYAVAKGRQEGIFSTWAECERQVKGFGGARYKKFKSENEALQFISKNEGSVSNHKTISKQKRVASYTNTTSKYKKNLPTSTANVKKPEKKPNTSKIVTSKPVKSKISDDESSDEDFPDQNFINNLIIKEMNKVEKKVNAVKKSVDKIYGHSKPSASTSSVSKTQKRTIVIDAQKRPNKDGPSSKRQKISNFEFETDDNDYVQVYTDGSCIGNGTSSARAGLGVFFGNDHPLNICLPVSGRATNNCGEIQAATKAIKLAHKSGVKKLKINTDSQFVINAATQWMKGWKRKGWKLASGEPVKNEVDFKDLDSVLPLVDVKFNYVKAHNGVHGNEMADKLANEGAAMYRKK